MSTATHFIFGEDDEVEMRTVNCEGTLSTRVAAFHKYRAINVNCYLAPSR